MPDLEQDLAFYGLPLPTPAWDGPSITSDGALIGCLYVLEGSTKGGRVIFRRMSRVLGISDEGGGRFFNGYGRSTEAHWQEFWKFAAHYCPNSQLEQARESAEGLFDSYVTLLDSYQEMI